VNALSVVGGGKGGDEGRGRWFADVLLDGLLDRPLHRLARAALVERVEGLALLLEQAAGSMRELDGVEAEGVCGGAADGRPPGLGAPAPAPTTG
jgi:hypothetical protein